MYKSISFSAPFWYLYRVSAFFGASILKQGIAKMAYRIDKRNQ
jgi:uncharacterized membrane protein HdeD (DUF308 family)